MKKKVSEKLKILVKDAMRRYAWNIGVSHYHGDILWMDENKQSEDGGQRQVHASMTTDRRCLRSSLKIYPDAIRLWEEQGDEFIERVIAHEVAHLATEELYDIGIATYRNEGEMTDARERLTEQIGRLSVKLDETLRSNQKNHGKK